LDPKCGCAYLSYSNYFAHENQWSKAGEYANKAIKCGEKIDPRYIKELNQHGQSVAGSAK
jgi:hypothetical protein